MDRGDLVPDAVMMGIMKEALASPSAANGAILDGVVRTTPQAAGMADMLAQIGKKVAPCCSSTSMKTSWCAD